MPTELSPEESRASDGAEEGEDLRFCSPIKHRQNRFVGEVVEPFQNTSLACDKGSDVQPMRTSPRRRKIPISEGSDSTTPPNGVVKTMKKAQEDGSREEEGLPTTKEPKPRHHKAVPEPDVGSGAEGLTDEKPVTISAADLDDSRRKRIKKVSHYVLGPLLGSGMYGVVRDAVDISAVPQWAAVMKNASFAKKKAVSSTSEGEAAGEGESSVEEVVNATHQQFHRCAVKLMTMPSVVSDHKSLMTAGKRRIGNNRASMLQAAFFKEVENLQRFHCPNIMRGIDIFSRHGKEYIVLPIAICSLHEFILRRRQYDQNGKQWLDQEASLRHGSKGLRRLGPHHSESHPGSPEKGNENSVLGDVVNDEEEDLSSESSDSQDQGVSLELLSTASPYSSPSYSPRGLAEESCRENDDDHEARVSNFRLPPGPVGVSPREALSATKRGGPSGRPTLFSVTFIRGVFYQLLRGVAYLHEQNLAHNDIKASNMLLFEDGTLRLTDLSGISSKYNDQGTPLFASPEICRYFYLCGDDLPSNSASQLETSTADSAGVLLEKKPKEEESPSEMVEIDSKASDMWCCGLLLYALVTGRPGPLPVQKEYDKFHQDPASEGKHFPMNRFQLYRIIAAQKMPVDLSDVPHCYQRSRDKGCAQRGSLRDLIAGLLEIDPKKRLSAEQALRHPWMELKFVRRGGTPEWLQSCPGVMTDRSSEGLFDAKSSIGGKEENHSAGTSGTVSSRPISRHHHDPQCFLSSTDIYALSNAGANESMDLAVQREVAQWVLASSHFREMLLRDKRRHLQFVADCCFTLGIPIPREILIPSAVLPGETRAPETPNRDGEPAMGTVVRYGYPEKMPPGFVDPALFLPESEADYYARKGGKPEYDLRALLTPEPGEMMGLSLSGVPIKVQQFEEYLHNVLMVDLGFRTMPDPSFAAVGAGEYVRNKSQRLPRLLPSSHERISTEDLKDEAGRKKPKLQAHSSTEVVRGEGSRGSVNPSTSTSTATLNYSPPSSLAPFTKIARETSSSAQNAEQGVPSKRNGKENTVSSGDSHGKDGPSTRAETSGSRRHRNSNRHGDEHSNPKRLQESSRCFCGLV